eukprot:TRINITY_DN5825_c0_g1_i10.p1 TRINITY_DN5825_c0_g1~~TRINITY_DN5825_c0_g1_i10.p1  ORF type:complete len:180 (-),score=54.55 TRINITY_DN5825_c0_g1_i10:82-621(-)
MCIRDRYQRRVHGIQLEDMGCIPDRGKEEKADPGGSRPKSQSSTEPTGSRVRVLDKLEVGIEITEDPNDGPTNSMNAGENTNIEVKKVVEVEETTEVKQDDIVESPEVNVSENQDLVDNVEVKEIVKEEEVYPNNEDIVGIESQSETKTDNLIGKNMDCLLYTSPSPRDLSTSRMPSSA